MYISAAELKSAIYQYQIDEITENDASIVLMAIQAAEEEVRGYLRNGRGLAPAYDLATIFSRTGAARSALLTETIKTVAVWHLVKLCNADVIYEHVKERYDRALAWLKDVNRGQITLDLPLIIDPLNPTGTVEVFRAGSRPKFNHE